MYLEHRFLILRSPPSSQTGLMTEAAQCSGHHSAPTITSGSAVLRPRLIQLLGFGGFSPFQDLLPNGPP